MTKLFRVATRLIMVAVALLLILFAVNNRESVTVNLWPLPFAASAPFYLILLATLALGVLLGGLAALLTSGRRLARRVATSARQIRDLENEVRALRARIAERQHAGAAAPEDSLTNSPKQLSRVG